MLPPNDVNSLDPTMRGMANQNFYTDVITIFGTIGLLFPKHPEADQWVADFIADFERQLTVHVYPSGVWEESHTYWQHVLFTVLPVFKMLKERGRHDFFADPRLQKTLNAIYEQVGVANALLNGRRGLITCGDHDCGVIPYHSMWGGYAEELRDTAPELAAKINYLARESGGFPVADLSTTAPAKGVREIKALGAYFRGAARDGDETILVLRSGAAWGHHHNDDGAIQLFYGDRMLVGDGGLSGGASGPYKISAAGHSRWNLKNAAILNYRWRFNRGWLTASDFTGEFPYATAYTPASFEFNQGIETPLPRVIRHFRSVIKLGAAAFLIVDSTIEPCDEEILFHCAGDELVLTPRDENHSAAALAKNGDRRTRITCLTADSVARGITLNGAKDQTMTTTAAVFTPPVESYFSAFVIEFTKTAEFDAAPAVELSLAEKQITVKVGGKVLALRHWL
jgi:hypothetical protein